MLIIKNIVQRKQIIGASFSLFLIIFLVSLVGLLATAYYLGNNIGKLDYYSKLDQTEIEKRIKKSNFDYLINELEYYKKIKPEQKDSLVHEIKKKASVSLILFFWLAKIAIILLIIAACNYFYHKYQSFFPTQQKKIGIDYWALWRRGWTTFFMLYIIGLLFLPFGMAILWFLNDYPLIKYSTLSLSFLMIALPIGGFIFEKFAHHSIQIENMPDP